MNIGNQESIYSRLRKGWGIRYFTPGANNNNYAVVSASFFDRVRNALAVLISPENPTKTLSKKSNLRKSSSSSNYSYNYAVSSSAPDDSKPIDKNKGDCWVKDNLEEVVTILKLEIDNCKSDETILRTLLDQKLYITSKYMKELSSLSSLLGEK